MAKFLLFIIVMSLLVTIYFAIKQIIENNSKDVKTVSKDNLKELDDLIIELKQKINLAEVEASRGILDAELRVEQLKEQLKKVEELKNKFN